MVVKVFTQPLAEYDSFVCRLYGAEQGQRLHQRYHQLLDRNRCWTGRLTWQGVGVYDQGMLVGHAVVQQPFEGTDAFLGFIESVNKPTVAKTLLSAALKLFPPHRYLRVFAPVDLSMWHESRFVATAHEAIAFQPPQQLYYPELFAAYFPNKMEYATYQWELPKSRDGAVPPPGVTVGPLSAPISRQQWGNMYRLIDGAFFDAPAPPSVDEFIELYQDRLREPDYTIVAQNESGIIGLVYFRISQGTVSIKTLAVQPELQHQGIGRLLFYSCLAQGYSRGCTKAHFLNLREDRLITQLLPEHSLPISRSILYYRTI